MVAFAIIAAIGVVLVVAMSGSAQAENVPADSSGGEDNSPDSSYTDDAEPNPGDEFGSEYANQGQVSNYTSNITTDPDTWPGGDRIWDICRAIGIAEGYNTNGAAFNLNNPGDISDGASTYGSEYHDGSNITHFPDAATGFNWLYQKIQNHINGKSASYPKSFTITQFAKVYAGNWQNWKNNVGQQLGVNPDQTTFADYVNS